MARIPGKMRRRQWVRDGDLIIVWPWDFQDAKADVKHRYTKTQAMYLSRKGVLPPDVDIFGMNTATDDDDEHDDLFGSMDDDEDDLFGEADEPAGNDEADLFADDDDDDELFGEADGEEPAATSEASEPASEEDATEATSEEPFVAVEEYPSEDEGSDDDDDDEDLEDLFG
jgi:hypothetical protein